MLRTLAMLIPTALLIVASCDGASITAELKHGRGLESVREGVFLRAEGDALYLGDRAVRWVGVNAGVIHGATARETMPRVMEALGRDALAIARVWALGESEGDEAWRREVAFRVAPDAWVDESFVHLDRVLAEARERRVRVVLVLVNRWGDRGGLPQYARWAGLQPRYRNLLPAEEAHVLADPRVRASFMEHVERLVTRVNSITGVAYRDDPTIAAWELFNEMGARTCAMQEALVPWIEHAAARIRELDPNHLIGAGHIGYNSEQSLRFWREVHTLPLIGYADTHGYPQNLLEATRPERLGAWLDHRAAEARTLQKPLIVGEIGVPRNDAGFDRALWLQRFLERADQNGTDAVMVWIYRGDERDDPHGIWAWGRFAEETAPVRHVLSDASKRWLREDAQAAGLDVSPSDFPLGLAGIRPHLRGEEEGDELVLDPWQLAEGCVDDEQAWVEHVIAWSTERDSFSLGFRHARHGRIRVQLDRVHVGTWIDGRFERNAVTLPSATWVWLRLVAEDPAGRRLLGGFTRELPGMETIRIR